MPPPCCIHNGPSFPTHVLKHEHRAYIIKTLDSAYEAISGGSGHQGEIQRALAAISDLHQAFLEKNVDPTIPLNFDPDQLKGRDYLSDRTLCKAHSYSTKLTSLMVMHCATLLEQI